MTHEPAHKPHEEQEKVNYLSIRFIDILELLYKENKRAIDVTVPRLNGEVVEATIKLSVKEKTVA